MIFLDFEADCCRMDVRIEKDIVRARCLRDVRVEGRVGGARLAEYSLAVDVVAEEGGLLAAWTDNDTLRRGYDRS